MDKCASVLLAFPPARALPDDEQYDKAIKSHLQKLERLLVEQQASLSASAGQLLDHLDPSVHSISYLVLLPHLYAASTQSSQSIRATSNFRERATIFIYEFDPRQMRYAGSYFSYLLGLLESGEAFSSSVAVRLLATALLRLEPTGSMFTSHHLPLLKLAYDTNHIESVLELINKRVVFYPLQKNQGDTRRICNLRLPPPSYIHLESEFTDKPSTSDVLEYDLLCGMCHLSRRDWQAAFDAFERVITFPAKEHGCSKIMVEAYNKWLLVGLLLKGTAQPTPSLAGQGPQKIFASLGAPYLAVAEAFHRAAGGAEVLMAEFDTRGEKFWLDDGNLGLMHEVMRHFQRWQIVKLRDIYSKISIEQIRKLTQSAETGKELPHAADVESLVQDMIDSGMLSGVIERPEGAMHGDGQGHLTFHPSAEELSEDEFAAELRASAQRLKQLEPIVKAVNERLGTSRDYVSLLIRDRKLEADSARDPVVAFDSLIDDEDLMAGHYTGR